MTTTTKEPEVEIEKEEEVKLSLFAEYYTRKLVAIFNNFNTEPGCKTNLGNVQSFSHQYAEMQLMDTLPVTATSKKISLGINLTKEEKNLYNKTFEKTYLDTRK